MNIIHIGAPKTASTLIQNVLNDERDALASVGVNVPDLGWDRERGHYGFRTSLNRAVNGDPYHEALRKDFRRILSDPQETQLISTETLWPVTPISLLRVFPELSDTQILFFCRSQEDIILSHYFQKIKGGRETRTLERFFEAEKENYDYFRLISTWEASFGPGNVHPILYEQALSEGGLCCAKSVKPGPPLSPDALIRRAR